ncbi:MAG: hypothetical protein AAF565_01050 [Pseudomonadota bacterium]
MAPTTLKSYFGLYIRFVLGSATVGFCAHFLVCIFWDSNTLNGDSSSIFWSHMIACVCIAYIALIVSILPGLSIIALKDSAEKMLTLPSWEYSDGENWMFFEASLSSSSLLLTLVLTFLLGKMLNFHVPRVLNIAFASMVAAASILFALSLDLNPERLE